MLRASSSNGKVVGSVTAPFPAVLQRGAIPSGVGNSGSVAANGALTFGTALDMVYSSGIWWYFPAGAVFAGSVAGSYWLVMSSTTVGTIFNNVYSGSGPLTPPSSPTPIVAAGPGAFTGVITQVTLAGFTVPANSLGNNGGIWEQQAWSFTGSTNAKVLTSTFGGTIINQETVSVAATTGGVKQNVIENYNSPSVQKSLSPYGFQLSTGFSSFGPPHQFSINTAINQLYSVTAQNSVATEFIIYQGGIIELISDGT